MALVVPFCSGSLALPPHVVSPPIFPAQLAALLFPWAFTHQTRAPETPTQQAHVPVADPAETRVPEARAPQAPGDETRFLPGPDHN